LRNHSSSCIQSLFSSFSTLSPETKILTPPYILSCLPSLTLSCYTFTLASYSCACSFTYMFSHAPRQFPQPHSPRKHVAMCQSDGSTYKVAEKTPAQIRTLIKNNNNTSFTLARLLHGHHSALTPAERLHPSIFFGLQS
jgi:hypothetical protein